MLTPRHVKGLGAPWTEINHLSQLTAISNNSGDRILVAFDLEGWTESVNEIELAYLQISPSTLLKVVQHGDVDAFHDLNHVKAHTIAIAEREHAHRPGAPKYGDRAVVCEADIEQTLRDMMSKLRAPGRQIVLVGYDMITEFDWLAQNCRSLASLFHHWVDVQELVHKDCGAAPGLANLMAHLAGEVMPPSGVKKKSHRAAVDAVKILAAASTFFAGIPMQYHAARTVKLCSQKPRKWNTSAFRAKVTAADGGFLPASVSSPRMLARRLETFDLKTVYIDAKKTVEGRSRTWWIAVHTPGMLDELASHLMAQPMDGQDLRVEKLVAPWTEIYGQHVPDREREVV